MKWIREPAKRAKQRGGLARHVHEVPQRGSDDNTDPTGKRTTIRWILSQPRTLCQQKQKRRMVGGHHPPNPSGGMNDVRSLEQADANSMTRSGGDGISWSQTHRKISFPGRIPK